MSPEAPHLSVGRRGEEFAQSLLEARGYQIVRSNYRCEIGEIDFICRDGEELVFVEVKTRRSEFAGTPEESVHPRKQRKLFRIAEWYLNETGYRGEYPCRFDVISITASEDGEPASYEFFRDAFCRS